MPGDLQIHQLQYYEIQIFYSQNKITFLAIQISVIYSNRIISSLYLLLTHPLATDVFFI